VIGKNFRWSASPRSSIKRLSRFFRTSAEVKCRSWKAGKCNQDTLTGKARIESELRPQAIPVEEAKIREHLAQVDRIIRNFRGRIAEQRRRTETLSTDGHPTDVAEKTLKAYQKTLEVMVNLREVIITELENHETRRRSPPR
jgi:hypothetical protein